MTSTEMSFWIIRGIVVITALTIHEFAHGIVSHSQGDKTPEYYGRLTLNPLAHLDLTGLICLLLFRFGWAKPVPISSYEYKHKRLGIIFTSIAGPFSNLLLAFFSIIIVKAVNIQSDFVYAFLGEMFYINIGLAVFNMIPIPPLDGSKVVAEIFNGRIADFIYRIEGRGTIFLFLLLWLEPVRNVISTAIVFVAFYLNAAAVYIVKFFV